MRSNFKILFFYWTSSFTIATLSYFILWIVLPGYQVFGSLYRMIDYHIAHPIAFIAIPCFFYGIIALFFTNIFLYESLKKRFMATLAILFLVVFLSSPLGGILWHFYDMKAGYFPKNWMEKMLFHGSWEGTKLGWLIALLSFPYNLLGVVVTYFLTNRGSKLVLKS